LDILPENAVFNYHNVSKENMTALYETNLFRIRTEPSFNFGTLKDVDGNLFEAYEI
jgi:hypothetical protein